MQAISHQTGSQQDYAVCGHAGESDFIGVMDGHGTSKCIDFIRGIDFFTVAAANNPAQHLFDCVQTAGNMYGSGATFTFAKITGQLLEIWNIGDSETRVYVNGSLFYSTPIHTLNNPHEVLRVQPYLAFTEPTHAPFPVSDTRIENQLSPVGHYTTGEKLVPSQSLGHNNMTGFAPSYHRIEFAKTDHIRVVCGSDGLFDMLVDSSTGTAQQLVDEAERRWRQPWDYYDGTRVWKGLTFNAGIDDISCAILEL